MKCVREANADVNTPCGRCAKVGRQCIPPTSSQAPFEDRRYRKSRSDQRRPSQDPSIDFNHQGEVTSASPSPAHPILPSIYSTSPYANHIHHSQDVQTPYGDRTLEGVIQSSKSGSIPDDDTVQFIEMQVTPSLEISTSVNYFS
jgi:hypothetical protein